MNCNVKLRNLVGFVLIDEHVRRYVGVDNNIDTIIAVK